MRYPETPESVFFDNVDVVGAEGEKFENLIALHLLKRLHYLEDYQSNCCGKDRDFKKNHVRVIADIESS